MVILGRGGAGKSALARQLSELTGLPAVPLDALFWHSLPTIMRAIKANASHAEVYILRNPAMVRRFVADRRQTASKGGTSPGR